MRYPPITALLAALLLAAPVARAADAADDNAAMSAAAIVPADVAVFIQLDGIAQLRQDWKVDPLGVYLREALPFGDPANSNDEAWLKVQQMLGMDGDAIVDTYFGDSVVIVGKNAGQGAPGVVLSKVDRDDQERAKTKLNLKPIEGAAGQFALYHTEDAKGILAFGPQWIALGDARNEDYIRVILRQIGEGENRLADLPDFKVWTGRLPAPRFATVFVHDRDKNEYHAVGLVRKDRDLTIRYAGASGQMRDVFRMMQKGAALDFGPAPQQTIAALSINMLDRDPDPRRLAFLDQFIAPKTVVGDILPKISGPIVLMFGQVPADRVVPATDLPTPAVAAAIKMADPAVSQDIDRIADSLLLFVNMAAAQRGIANPVVETVQYENHIYRSIDLGPLAAAAGNRPERAGMVKVAFGRIGDWYMVASHEVFFQQALDAVDDPTKLLAADPIVKKMPLEATDQPILTGLLKTQRLASMLGLVEMYLSTENPEAAEQASAKNPDSGMGRIIKGIRTVGTILNHHTSITVQAQRGTGSGEYIEARIDFVRTERK